MPDLKVNELVFEREGFRLEATFALRDGERVCLLGPSGSGKTTLLRIIAGLIDADSGTVSLDAQEITHMPPEKRGFGAVFQDPALFPHQSVKGNIDFGLKQGKCKKSLRDSRTLECAQMLQIAHLLNKPADEISGGEQQRVAIARALAPQPRILLLDEALKSLDPILAHQLRTELVSCLNAAHVSTIFVTHDLGEASIFASRVIIIHHGKIIFDGDIAQLYRRPTFGWMIRFFGLGLAFRITAVVHNEGLSCAVTDLGQLPIAPGHTQGFVFLPSPDLHIIDSVKDSSIFSFSAIVARINPGSLTLHIQTLSWLIKKMQKEPSEKRFYVEESLDCDIIAPYESNFVSGQEIKVGILKNKIRVIQSK